MFSNMQKKKKAKTPFSANHWKMQFGKMTINQGKGKWGT